ncbi:MAG: hypothetical protein KC645_19630, partial [Gemmatimonadetes bacterium]|nr:hypothetical protein [Gemmatimonadota bacterium]
DVYALGVVLYELLSGQRPYTFATGSLQEIEDLVCNTDPRPPSARVAFRDDHESADTGGLPRTSWLRTSNPSTLRQGLSGDLDSIVLKAMEKEPARRYGTAAELRQDLLNYLEGRPVDAHAQTGLYRMGKFIRRNRLVVGLGSAAAAALVIGAGVATAFGLEAQRARRLAEDQAQRAQRTQDFMVSVLETFDPNETDGQVLSSRSLITRAMAELDTLSGQPLLKAGSLNALGQVAFNLGERHLADSIFAMSEQILRRDTLDVPLLATTLSWQGRLANEREEPDAIELLRQAVALRESDPAHSDRLLAADLLELAFALTVPDSAGPEEYAESQDLLDRAHAMGLDERLEARRLEYQGDLEFTRDDYVAARELYRQSRDLRLHVLPENHPELGRAWLGLGVGYRWTGQPDSAVFALQRSAEIFAHAYGERHPLLGNALYRTGLQLVRTGRVADGESYLRQAIDQSSP